MCVSLFFPTTTSTESVQVRQKETIVQPSGADDRKSGGDGESRRRQQRKTKIVVFVGAGRRSRRQGPRVERVRSTRKTDWARYSERFSEFGVGIRTEIDERDESEVRDLSRVRGTDGRDWEGDAEETDERVGRPRRREYVAAGNEREMQQELRRADFKRNSKVRETRRTHPNTASAEEKKPTTQQEGDKSNWKNSKNLFISIDEASNHVRPFGPNKVKAFRLLFTIFQLECDPNGHAIPNVDLSKAKFLGSGFSTPIRVFANNDVPKGAAAIEVRCSVQSNWNGWKQKPYATEEALKEAFSDLPQEKHARW